MSALVKAAETPAEKVAVAAAHADWSVPGALGLPRLLRRVRRDHLVRLPAPQPRHAAGAEPGLRVGLRLLGRARRRGRSSARAARCAARRRGVQPLPRAVSAAAPRRSCRRRSSARACRAGRRAAPGRSTGATSSTRVSRLRGIRSAEPISTVVLVAALERVDPRVLEEAADDRDDADVLATRRARPGAGSRCRAR